MLIYEKFVLYVYESQCKSTLNKELSMASLSDIIAFSNDYLNANRFSDYCPNGLQVEGRGEVRKIVTGVTASQALIDGAIKNQADMILVHHGFFWRGESPEIIGIKKQRISALLKNDISLLAYHLPLDAHAIIGNNVQLARELGLNLVGVFGKGGDEIGVIAESKAVVFSDDFSAHLSRILNRTPVHLGAKKRRSIKKIAICTGGAQGYFQAAIEAGVDAFITGEVSESSYHLAMESGVDYYSCGHHATERYGVRAFGQLLAERFLVEHQYLEIDNPV